MSPTIGGFVPHPKMPGLDMPTAILTIREGLSLVPNTIDAPYPKYR